MFVSQGRAKISLYFPIIIFPLGKDFGPSWTETYIARSPYPPSKSGPEFVRAATAASGSRRSLPGNCPEGRWAAGGGPPPLVCSVVWGHLEGGTATGVAPFFSSSSVALESSILFFLLGRLSLRVESLLSIPAWPMGVGIDYPFFFFPAARQARTGTEKRS